MTLLPRRSFLQAVAALLPASLLPRTLRADDPAAPPTTKPIHRDQDRYLPAARVIPNGTSTFKVSSKDCRNDFFAMEHHHTAKGGPPLHLHHVEDEWFYVMEGEYRVKVGDTLYSLHAGDSVLGPRGVPHAFAFVGPTSGRLLITYAPAGQMEEFFDSRDRSGGRKTYVFEADAMRAFGMELLGPPLAVD